MARGALVDDRHDSTSPFFLGAARPVKLEAGKPQGKTSKNTVVVAVVFVAKPFETTVDG